MGLLRDFLSDYKREKALKKVPLKLQNPCKSMIYRGFLVPGTGFEPAHPCERCDLNTVRLPISPPGQIRKNKHQVFYGVQI